MTIDWQRASFSVKYPDPSESGIMFSLAHGYKNGQFGCWTSILLPQLLRAFEDEETGHKIGEKHISWLREIGAKGKKDIGIDMSELAGREEHLIKWLEATVAEIHAAARSE